MSSHGTWDSRDEDDEEYVRIAREEDQKKAAEVPKPLRIRPSQQDVKDEGGREPQAVPASLRPGPGDRPTIAASEAPRKQSVEYKAYAQPSTATSSWTAPSPPQTSNGPQQASSNPYRRKASNEHPAPTYAPPPPPPMAWPDAEASPQLLPYVSAAQAPNTPVEMPTTQTPTDELSRMSLGDAKAELEQPQFETVESIPVPQQARQEPVRPPYPTAVSESQDAVPQRQDSSTNPWGRASQDAELGDIMIGPPVSASPPSSAPTQPAAIPLQQEQPKQPAYYPPPPGPPPKTLATTSLIDPLVESSLPHTRPSSPVHAPPPALSPTRPEHYQIKNIRWLSPSSSDLRVSPILTQNANGPCPLLALVNALVLSTPLNLHTPLIETLQTREQVSLGLLLDAVFEELMSGRRSSTSSAGEDARLPDVGELYAFLLALHTGMNVNPRFVSSLHSSSSSSVGTFEDTKEMRLYSTFGVPLIHGWTPPLHSKESEAMRRTAQTFEDAQNVQFAESELEDKTRSLEGLDAREEEMLNDIRIVKHFLDTWPTQLTDYGLKAMSDGLKGGQVAILFRNDHFATVYKEPQGGALMTLVTDQGYSSHEEIVWESLVDVRGQGSELFSGDFRSVSHGGSGVSSAPMDSSTNGAFVNHNEEVAPPLPGPRPVSQAPNYASIDPPPSATPAHVVSATEQEDHDLALALQLQEEEEDQQRQADIRRRRERDLSERFLSSPEGPRPAIPPRRSGNAAPAGRGTAAPTGGRPPVNRPADAEAGDTVPPPSYEQSAGDRPYRPGVGGSRGGSALGAYDALRRGQAGMSSPSPQQQQYSGRGGGSSRGRGASDRPGMGRIPGAYGSGQPLQSPQGQRVQGAAGLREAEDKCVIM